MSNSQSLHLIIAEWMLERGETVSAYDVSEKFGININQSRAFMTVLEKDSAIKTKRGANAPSHTLHGYGIRTLKVTAIDREKIANRKKRPHPHHINYRHHTVESISNLSSTEKWELIISNSRRRKK